ncbi:MAG: MFS transporter [Bdellovibrionales bacterium]|nr:MFS transporter [Bdellovibrionales bacterium]
MIVHSGGLPSDFRKLLGARFLFTFAVQMQAIVLGWRIYDLMKDPLYLGLIGLMEAIPAIGLALWAGYLVDRLRPLFVYRQVMYVSLVSGLIVLTEHLFETRFSLSMQVGLLYAAAFLTGMARSFAHPALFSAIPKLVERSHLLRASAMSSSVMQVARIGGPAFGGLIFGFYGAVTASSIICILLVTAAFSMSLIKTEIPRPQTTHHHNTITEEFLSGAKFVFKHSILLPALSLDMIAVLFGGVIGLLPIFAEEILFVGPKGLGMLRAAPAVGAVMMSLYLSRTNRMRTGKWLLTGVAGFGFSILIFGLSRNFYLSLAALAFSGAFDSISMVIRSAAVQLSSPDHMRGKISAVNSIFIGSSNELGELESGIAAKLMGTIPAVYFGGIICLCTVAIVGFMSPALRNLDLAKMENP